MDRLTIIQRSPHRIVFDSGEWFDPSKAKSFDDKQALKETIAPEDVTLWCTESGQWLREHANSPVMPLPNGNWWEKLTKKEAAARLLINGYEEPEGVDYNYLKI